MYKQKKYFILLRKVNKSKSSRCLLLTVWATAAKVSFEKSLTGVIPVSPRRGQCWINFDLVGYSGFVVMCVCVHVGEYYRRYSLINYSLVAAGLFAVISLCCIDILNQLISHFYFLLLSFRMSCGWSEHKSFTSIIFRPMSNHICTELLLWAALLKQRNQHTTPRRPSLIFCTPLFHT